MHILEGVVLICDMTILAHVLLLSLKVYISLNVPSENQPHS